MAIIFDEVPTSAVLHPTYNRIQYLISSANVTAQYNYKFVVELRQGSTTLVKQRIQARPGEPTCIVDMAKLISAYIEEDTTNLTQSTSDIQDESGNYEDFLVRAIDYYSTSASGAPSQQRVYVTGNTISAINAAFRYRSWASAQNDTLSDNWQGLFSTAGAEGDNCWMSVFDNLHTIDDNGATDVADLGAKSTYEPLRLEQLMPHRS